MAIPPDAGVFENMASECPAMVFIHIFDNEKPAPYFFAAAR
jgi:hypothetical protein